MTVIIYINLLTFAYYVCLCNFNFFVKFIFTFTFAEAFICCKLFTEIKLLPTYLLTSLTLLLFFLHFSQTFFPKRWNTKIQIFQNETLRWNRNFHIVTKISSPLKFYIGKRGFCYFAIYDSEFTILLCINYPL